MDEVKTEIRISVRALVEFILREGDLDNRRTGKADLQAMQAGGRLTEKYREGWEQVTPQKFR